MIKNQSIAESAVDNETGPIRPTLMPVLLEDPPCECRLPFYPLESCAFCFHIPSHKFYNLVRFDQFSKESFILDDLRIVLAG